MKLIVKLVGGFGIVALIALAVGLVGVFAISQLKGSLKDIGDNRLPSVESLLIISEAQTAVDAGENALLATNIDAEGRAAQYARFDAAKVRSRRGPEGIRCAAADRGRGGSLGAAVNCNGPRGGRITRSGADSRGSTRRIPPRRRTRR